MIPAHFATIVSDIFPIDAYVRIYLGVFHNFDDWAEDFALKNLE
ncbi:MAG: hypothetical protein ACI85H_001759 [Paracoccaceae bacterium]|jgi:hypothetical protein